MRPHLPSRSPIPTPKWNKADVRDILAAVIICRDAGDLDQFSVRCPRRPGSAATIGSFRSSTGGRRSHSLRGPAHVRGRVAKPVLVRPECVAAHRRRVHELKRVIIFGSEKQWWTVCCANGPPRLLRHCGSCSVIASTIKVSAPVVIDEARQSFPA
jgi:hypothetical protein